MKTYVILTSNAEHINNKLHQFNIIKIGYNNDGKRVFPDGEIYVRIPDVSKISGERALIIHSGMPDPNQGLLEFEFILEIVHSVKPSILDVLFLYFPFGMQDSVFAEGESNVAEAICRKLTHYYKVNNIFVVDAHFFGKNWTRDYPIINLSAEDQITNSIYKDNITNFLRLAPDIGGQRRTGIIGLNKKRKNSFTVKLEEPFEVTNQVNNRLVVVWDDIIETGGTMVRASKLLEDLQVKKIFAAATHGVMISGVERIKKQYAKLYLTNTINNKYANVDITPLVINVIKNETE